MEYVAAQIAALNKADLLFRLQTWHSQQAQTEVEQRHYAQTSLLAACLRAQILSWLEEHHVELVRRYGEYMQVEA